MLQTYATKQVAEILDVAYTTVTQALFDGKITNPKNKVGRSWVWSAEEVERASWALNRRSAGLVGKRTTEHSLDADETTEASQGDADGLTMRDVLQTVLDVDNELLQDAYRAGRITA